MKKLISLTLTTLLCAALLAGCNNTPAPTPGGEEGAEVLRILDTAYAVEDYAIAVAKDNTALLDQINTALAELKDAGTLDAIVAKYIDGTPNELTFQTDVAEGAPVLTMGTNAYFPPYEFYDGDAIVGIDAEVAAAIADKLGMKLEIQDMEFDSVLVAVQTGSIDMGMAGITVTEERQQTMSFSDSYATGVQSIIVKTDSPITSVDDLFAEGANHKIGTQMATTGYLYATWDIEDEGLGTVEGYPKGSDAVLALIAGQVDCVIIDNEPAKAFVAFHNGTK
jgi:polar amino acid transport system substrate-binding protein